MKFLRKPALAIPTGAALFAILVYGCNDFLTQPPQGTLNEVTLASKAGVEATLVSAYRQLDISNNTQNWGGAASNWALDLPGDDAYKGSTFDDQPPAAALETYAWGSGDAMDYLEGKWQTVYEGISRANATLRLLDKVRNDKPGEISDEEAANIRGQAIFLRAHYHFEAWEVWGNVPYYKEDDTDFRKPNDQPVIPLIEADLQEAMSLLPATQSDYGRVNKWTAEAYLGRVQVYAGEYSDGQQTLRDVVASGVYSLEPDFSKVWTTLDPWRTGPENILAYQSSANDGNPNADNANWGERLNFPHSGSPFFCCGFHNPSQNLVNFFRVDANGLPLALSDPSWNNNDAAVDASFTGTVDPRLDWTVGRPGVPYKDWPSSPDGNGYPDASWVRDVPTDGPYVPKKNVQEFQGVAQHQAHVGWQPEQQNDMPIHIYRYADALLLLAEADVAQGDLVESCNLVNQIRERASVAVQGPGTSSSNWSVPMNSPAITWANYKIGMYPCPFSSKDYGIEAVRAERRLELAMEGHRFFDLRRWGVQNFGDTPDHVINDIYLAKEKTRRSYLASTGAQWAARNLLYPLPNQELDLSVIDGEQRLKQNPGW